MESRNLCAFEKNVLLALIAAVIQPNKVSKVYFHWTFLLADGSGQKLHLNIVHVCM